MGILHPVLLMSMRPQRALRGNRGRAVIAGLIAAQIAMMSAPHDARAQDVPDARIDTGTAPGSAATSSVQVAVDGNLAYAAWVDFRNGPNGDLYFNRSADGGKTWSAQEIRLDTGSPPGASFSLDPSIVASAGAVFVAWVDRRNDPGGGDIYFNRSLDSGQTWLAQDLRLDATSPPGPASSDPSLAVDGGVLHAVWLEATGLGLGDVVARRSLDGGASWDPEVRLNTGSPPGAGRAMAPQASASAGTAVAVWMDLRNAPFFFDIYANRTIDGGSTWLAGDLRIDTGDPPGVSDSRFPRIAVEGLGYTVVFEDQRNGQADIYANRSLDGGTTWLPAAVRVDTGDPPGASRSSNPVVAAAGGVVHAAWEDARASPIRKDIYHNRSLDGGATWGATDRRLDTGTSPGAAFSALPRVTASGSAVYVAYEDDRNNPGASGARNIYMNRSLDAGVTWLPGDVRLDTGTSPSIGDSHAPSATSSATGLLVAWHDDRDSVLGRDDVYGNRFQDIPIGFLAFGFGVAGSGGFVPVLSGSGTPSPGAAISLDVTSGLGGAGGVLFLGLLPEAIYTLGGVLLVQPPFAAVNLMLAGPPGTPGAGTASLPLGIPPNPNLLGFFFTTQAGFFDPAAPAGVSWTQGLRIVIG